MRKLLKISDTLTLNLTFEEVLVKYKSLVKVQMFKYNTLRMEYDDKYQLATIALWNAYTHYDINRGTGFGLLAKNAIQNKFKEAFVYNNRKKRSGCTVISLDKSRDGEYDDDHEFLDFLESTEDLEGNMILKTILNDFISKLTVKQKETIALYLSGREFNEIAKILGVGQSTISMRMTAVKKTLNECMAM